VSLTPLETFPVHCASLFAYKDTLKWIYSRCLLACCKFTRQNSRYKILRAGKLTKCWTYLLLGRLEQTPRASVTEVRFALFRLKTSIQQLLCLFIIYEVSSKTSLRSFETFHLVQCWVNCAAIEILYWNLFW